MAKDFNQITICGRLGRDAEIKAIPSGKQVVEFYVAVNGFKDDETIWFRAVSFRDGMVKLAGMGALAKGKQVLVSGSLNAKPYVSKKTGEATAGLEILINDLQLLGSNDASQPMASDNWNSRAARAPQSAATDLSNIPF